MYGLSKEIKNYIDKKIDKNKTFLKNLTFYNEDYELISMFESDINANLSPQRYFAEVNNRVHTLFKIAKELDFVPAFITMTLPSEYHRMKGVYKFIRGKKIQVDSVYNQKYNGFTPRECSMFLSLIWTNFMKLKVFKHIKNNSGHNSIYIRVYEPHEDGTPHLHAMLFVPRQFLSDVREKFFEHLEDYGFDLVGQKWKQDFTHEKYEDELGAIAYILKYMNKTFKNAKEDKMTDEAYYYAYYGIRRFITSQTLVPLWLYRKIKHNEDTRDLYKLTKDYKQGHIFSLHDKEYIMHRYVNRHIEYDEDYNVVDVDIDVDERIIYQKNHFISDQFKFDTKRYEPVPTSWKKKKVNNVPIFENGKIAYIYQNGKIKKYQKHITQMSDVELYHYYMSYDVDNDSYVRYLSVINLLVSRGLLYSKLYNLNNFNFDEFIINE